MEQYIAQFRGDDQFDDETCPGTCPDCGGVGCENCNDELWYEMEIRLEAIGVRMHNPGHTMWNDDGYSLPCV